MERNFKLLKLGLEPSENRFFFEVSLADLYILESALNYQKDYFVEVLKSRKGRKKSDKIFRSAMRQHLAYMFDLYKDICDCECFIGSNRYEHLKKFLVKE